MFKRAKKKSTSLVPVEIIKNKIYFIRRQKVMIDTELAGLYGVDTKVLNQAVKRNFKRFPCDFMFKLTRKETKNLRSHFVTSNRGGRRYLPHAFTEQGIAMLSSVLNSDRAIEVNILIMRIFVRLKGLMLSHKDLARKIEALERKFQNNFNEHDQKFNLVFKAIKDLLTYKEEQAKKRRPIGFLAKDD